MKKLLLLLGFILSIPQLVIATSGACSYHNGVDCGRGWQADGRVYCVDGWTDSETFFEFTIKCQQNNLSPVCVDYIKGKDEYLKEINQMISNKQGEYAYSDTSNPNDAQRWQNYFNYLYTLRDRQLQRYYDIAKSCTDYINKLQYNYAIQLKKEDPDTTCKNSYGANSYYTGNQVANGSYICDCKGGYKWNDSKTNCVLDDKDGDCKKNYGQYSYWTGKDRECGCAENYQWDENNKQCIKKFTCNTPNILEDGTCLTPNEICTKHYGPNSYFNGNYNETSQIICDCQNGYEWKDNNECVLPKPATQPTKHDAKPVIINQPKTEDIKPIPKVQTELMSKVQTDNQKQPASTENAPRVKQTSRASGFFHGIFQTIKSLFRY